MTFSCETLPTDAKAAIREMKAALREQLGDVQQVSIHSLQKSKRVLLKSMP